MLVQSTIQPSELFACRSAPSRGHMWILTAEEVRKALPMRDAIEAMKRAFAALSDARAEVPLRVRMNIPPHEALSLVMPAFVQGAEGESFADSLAIKVVSLFP